MARRVPALITQTSRVHSIRSGMTLTETRSGRRADLDRLKTEQCSRDIRSSGAHRDFLPSSVTDAPAPRTSPSGGLQRLLGAKAVSPCRQPVNHE